MRAPLAASREAIAATTPRWPARIAGMTRLTPIFAVLSTPQLSFVMKRPSPCALLLKARARWGRRPAPSRQVDEQGREQQARCETYHCVDDIAARSPAQGIAPAVNDQHVGVGDV